MNFWNVLRWICAVLFTLWIVLILLSTHAHFDGASPQDAPRPAPLIVH
jgi:hypothetical protein